LLCEHGWGLGIKSGKTEQGDCRNSGEWTNTYTWVNIFDNIGIAYFSLELRKSDSEQLVSTSLDKNLFSHECCKSVISKQKGEAA
jgi:hypothetical protein